MDDGLCRRAVPKGAFPQGFVSDGAVRRCGPRGYTEGGAALDRDCAEGILQVLTVQP